jgi:hypothetical protein
MHIHFQGKLRLPKKTPWRVHFTTHTTKSPWVYRIRFLKQRWAVRVRLLRCSKYRHLLSLFKVPTPSPETQLIKDVFNLIDKFTKRLRTI